MSNFTIENKDGVKETFYEETTKNIVVPGTLGDVTFTNQPLIYNYTGWLPSACSGTKTRAYCGTLAANKKAYLSNHNFNSYFFESCLYLISFNTLTTDMTPADYIKDVKVVTPDTPVTGTVSWVTTGIGYYTDTSTTVTLGCDPGPYIVSQTGMTFFNDTYGGDNIFVLKINGNYYHIFASVGQGNLCSVNTVTASTSSSSSSCSTHGYWYGSSSATITQLREAIVSMGISKGFWQLTDHNANGQIKCLAETYVEASSSAVYWTFLYSGGLLFPSCFWLKV